MSTLKNGEVTGDLKKVKNNEARVNAVNDFFNQRDKSKRGSSGLIEDTARILGEEGKEKDRLFEKSMSINSFPDHVKPLFNGLFLTARRNKTMEKGLYLPSASFGSEGSTDLEVDFSDTQIVLETGPNVSCVSKGMEVVINVDKYKKRLSDTLAQKLQKEYEYDLPVKTIEGVEYLYITERDLSHIYNMNGVKLPKTK